MDVLQERMLVVARVERPVLGHGHVSVLVAVATHRVQKALVSVPLLSPKTLLWIVI